MAHILVIDDDRILTGTLVHALVTAGHSVVATPNGFDGVKLFRKDPADLVLTDIAMPYGGVPTIRILRAEFPQLPIIAMSGHPSNLELAVSVGATRTLSKPFSVSQLLGVVNEILAERAKGAKPPGDATKSESKKR